MTSSERRVDIRIFVTGGTFDKHYDEIAGKLTMKGTGPEPRVLAFRSGETFAANEALVIFERDAGRVVRLRLDTGGGHVVLKKKAGTGSSEEQPKGGGQ